MNIRPILAVDNSLAELVCCISSNTTTDRFDQMSNERPNYTLDMGVDGHTALQCAIAERNINLAKYIVEKGGKHLLFICDNEGKCPLHITPYIKDDNVQFLAAKTLIQLGTPIEIKYLGSDNDLLTDSLFCGAKKIATLCFRMGMVQPNWCMDKLKNLNLDPDQYVLEIRKEIMTPTEKLFKMHFNDLAAKGYECVPREIINTILLFSAKLI